MSATDEQLMAKKHEEHERCIVALQDIVQKKIIPVAEVEILIGVLQTVDAAIDWYIEKLERENHSLKKQLGYI